MSILTLLAYYVHDLNPFLIQWSERWGIRYYGLAYLAGFLAVFWGMRWFYRKGYSRVPSDQVADLLTWAVLGTLIGGRLGYCLLYDWRETLHDPVGVIAFWRGGIQGMASHGGFLGVILALWFFARRRGYAVWPIYDNLAVWATPGIFFGRLANFINGELWGRPTEVPWAVIFPEAPMVAGRMVPRHPSQIYEALLEGALLFAILFPLRLRQPRTGWLSGCFLILYGVVRIIGECFREPDEQIGFLLAGVTQGQLLSVFLILGGVMILILVPKHHRN